MSESNINVVIKMRPLIRRELEKKIPVCWRKNGKYLIDSTDQNKFYFDSIFDEDSTTAELYDKVARPIVSNALAGVNGTIFAYGQTSSGKTYTMMGDQGTDGIMMMAIKHIFNEVQSSHQEFVLRVGFIEIYNEKICDLYDPDNVDLKIVEINNDVNVNCKEVICKSVDDMFNVIKVGNRNKKIGDTDMNDRSSRSHTIFHIVIESIDAVSEKAKISSLNLVDLAGSERAGQTNTTGARFLEGVHINMSLLSLSKVINKLIKNDGGHINYRDSKLTRYLQSSLGGNALAAIICTVCPTTLDETISTLYFAQRAMEVTNKPKVNEIISDATMIKKLHNQIEALKSQLNMERAKNGANSAVPRLLQELSLHQGNILNYRSLESKHKLRRRTWNTFDNDLDVIPETNPLVLTNHKLLTERVVPLISTTPLLSIVNSGRGTGESFDDFPERGQMDDEFDYKSKYDKLLFDYEELLEFTNWEKELGIEPVSTSVEEKKCEIKVEETVTELVTTLNPEMEQQYMEQIEDLERERQRLEDLMVNLQLEMEEKYKCQMDTLIKDRKEMENALLSFQQEKESNDYLYELNQKKAEQREKDLVVMLEEMKHTDLIGNAVHEKNLLIAELQEQLRELALARDALELKVQKQEDVEQRLEKMSQVEVEIVELRNTITILSNTILTLENEKKEMSVRFSDSMSASTIDCLQAAVTITNTQSSQTDELESETSKLQTDYDEMSSKVMDLIEENEDFKQRIKEMEEKFTEINSDLSKKVAEVEALTEDCQRFELNSDTHEEELALLKSDKEWLEKNAKEMEKNIEDSKAKHRAQLDDLESQLSDKSTELEKMVREFGNQSEEVARLGSDKEHIHELTRERNQLKFELENLHEELNEKDGELKQIKEQSNHSQRELDRVQSQHADAQAKILELENQILAKLKEIQRRNEEIEDLNKEIGFLRDESERKLSELTTNQAQSNQMSYKVESLEIKLQEAQNQKLETEQEYEKMKEEFEGEIERSNLEKQEKEKSFNELLHQYEEANTKLSQLANNSDLEDQILTRVESANERIDELNNEIKSLKDEFEKKSMDLTSITTEKIQLEAMVDSLEVQARETEQEYEKKREDLMTEISRLNVEKQYKEDRFKELSTMVETMENKLTQVQRQTTEKDQEYEKMEQEYESELERFKLEKQERETSYNNLFKELEDAKLKLSHFEVENAKENTLEDQISAKVKEIEEANDRIQEFRKEIQSLRDESDKKSLDLSLIQTQYTELSNMVDSLKIKLEGSQGQAKEIEEKYEQSKLEFETELKRLTLEKQEKEESLNKLFHEFEDANTKLSQLEVKRTNEYELEDQILAKMKEIQRGNDRIEELNREIGSLKLESENKTSELMNLHTKYTHVLQKVDSLEIQLSQASEKDQEYEKTKREFVTEIGRLNLEKQDKEDHLKNVVIQFEDAKLKLSQLEVELARREPIATLSSSREESIKLKEEVKRLRSELNGFQNKERRARRSSTFDTNRDLLLGHCVGTMTDPVSEACQCEVLNEKVIELKKRCNFKDLEIVEIRESQKRSPMLLENYSLKKMVEQYKEREAQLVKQIASKKTMLSNQTQTLPDPLLEKFQDAQECIRVTKHKYEMAKMEIKSSRKQMQDLETQLSRQAAAFEADRKTLTELAEKKSNENDSAPANQADDQQGKKKSLQERYDFLKVVMEKRYFVILNLEEKLKALTAQKTCPKCHHRLPVPT